MTSRHITPPHAARSAKTVAVCQLCQSHIPAKLLDQRGICPECAAYNHANQGDKHLLSLTGFADHNTRGKGGMQ